MCNSTFMNTFSKNILWHLSFVVTLARHENEICGGWGEGVRIDNVLFAQNRSIIISQPVTILTYTLYIFCTSPMFPYPMKNQDEAGWIICMCVLFHVRCALCIVLRSLYILLLLSLLKKGSAVFICVSTHNFAYFILWISFLLVVRRFPLRLT